MAKVLVIEDDDQIRLILREVLEEEGYDVVEARDGREGVRSYLESSPDLVITDMVMPQKDGIQTIADLQGIYPEVKIIA
ncbi:MAG: response regulator, partial [Pseudomonadota bacterium]